MRVDKSLQEVWDWKEKGYNERKCPTMEERVNKIKEGVQELCKKYNLKLKTLHPSGK